MVVFLVMNFVDTYVCSYTTSDLVSTGMGDRL